MNKLEISAKQLRTHVYELAGVIGQHNIYHPEALNAAADYITGQWQQQGYVVRKQSYDVQGRECSNLEINCPGKSAGGELILIGAHYDSILGSPGANDNGSGVAALLKLPRLFMEVQPTVSLRFVAFVNEEPPFYFWDTMGSMFMPKRPGNAGIAYGS
jgi:Zn-dependent M28 family amino/carboxypeptidase